MDLRRFCGSSGRRQSRARAKGAVKRKALRAGLDVVAEDTTYKGFRLRPELSYPPSFKRVAYWLVSS
jgi:hypothetical protein